MNRQAILKWAIELIDKYQESEALVISEHASDFTEEIMELKKNAKN